MPGRATTLTCALVLTATLATTAAAQQLPDERSRREAVTSYRRGQQLLAEEKFAAAADNFLNAVSKDPLLTLAHYSLGRPT